MLPYHRILATVAAPEVPPAWAAQTRPGGRILTPRGSTYYNCGLLALAVEGSLAVNRIVGPASFMRLRDQRVPRFRTALIVIDEESATVSNTDLHAWQVAGDPNAAAAIGLRGEPGVRGGDVVEVPVVVQDRGAGVDRNGGKSHVDHSGCASGTRRPQCGANVDDDLVDVRREGQIEERTTQPGGRDGVVGRRSCAERELVQAERTAAQLVIFVQDGRDRHLHGDAAGQALENAVVDEQPTHRRAADRTSGSRSDRIGGDDPVDRLALIVQAHAQDGTRVDPGVDGARLLSRGGCLSAASRSTPSRIPRPVGPPCLCGS